MTQYNVALYDSSTGNSQFGTTTVAASTCSPTCFYEFTNTTSDYYYAVVSATNNDNLTGPTSQSNQTLDPVHCYSSSYCWGQDTVNAVTSSELSNLKSINGGTAPDFVGRYITNDTLSYDLTSSEVNSTSTFHTSHVGVLLIAEADRGDCPTQAEGKADADAALSKAASFGVHANTKIAISLDIEANSHPASACLMAYADEINASGFRAGFYNNPTAFGPAFCAISTSDKAVSNAFIWANESEPGNSSGEGAAGSPSFGPQGPGCTNGKLSGWQYYTELSATFPDGSGKPDRDEIAANAISVVWQP